MSASAQLRVAVLAGGRSAEHEVSLSSGRAVCAGLKAVGHEVLWVQIERDGTWRHADRPLSLCPGEGLLGADLAFAALHGPFGEDGTVQGLLETLDVAYVGAGVAASAICMDKLLFKKLMASAGVDQVEHVGVREQRWRIARAEVLDQIAGLGLPVFVKPAHLGSSVGIAKVSAVQELAAALEGAFEHDARVIVEAQARGIEIECGVLGPEFASDPGEIVFAGDWYDYAAKYTQGAMQLRIPPRITARAQKRVQELAVEVFERAGCEGLARVDFFVDGERVLVNELNTMPGFTPTSVYAKLMESSGIAYTVLLDRLCRLAVERHERRRGRAW